MAFRSLWVPLVSAVFNLLSVLAAYGVVVAVFQEGVGASLLGVDSGIPIVSFIPVILFAGLIMSAVFLAFVTQPDVIAKMMGLGLGLAILIDVLVVRLVIAPAVVTLLGDHAWWLPRWLDRILPNVSLEGHLVESLDKPEPPSANGSSNGHADGHGAHAGAVPEGRSAEV